MEAGVSGGFSGFLGPIGKQKIPGMVTHSTLARKDSEWSEASRAGSGAPRRPVQLSSARETQLDFAATAMKRRS